MLYTKAYDVVLFWLLAQIAMIPKMLYTIFSTHFRCCTRNYTTDLIWWMIFRQPPWILQEVRQCHQKEDPWLHLCRKRRKTEDGSLKLWPQNYITAIPQDKKRAKSFALFLYPDRTKVATRLEDIYYTWSSIKGSNNTFGGGIIVSIYYLN